MVPMSSGAPAAQLRPQLAQAGDLARQVAPARPLGEPAVSKSGGAADGRRGRAAHPDRRAGSARRTRRDPHVPGREARPGQLGEFVREGQGQRGHGLVGVAAALGEVTRQEFVLLGHVAGAHADDEPSARQVVDGRQLLGGAQRVALGEDQHVREEVGAGRHCGQPAQCGGRVVPNSAHGVGQPTRGSPCGHTRRGRRSRPRRPPGRCGPARPDRRPSPSRPRTASTATESGAACRRRPPPRGRPGRRRRVGVSGRSSAGLRSGEAWGGRHQAAGGRIRLPRRVARLAEVPEGGWRAPATA